MAINKEINTRMSLTIDKELKKKIEDIAKEEGVGSANKMFIKLIILGLEKYNEEQ